MLIFEDLHGIDGETQELLNLLADSIASSKILLLVSYRPEFSHQWAKKTYYTQLRLDPLGRESAEEMLDALLGAGSDFALKRFIIERAEGNPLFMEEIVQALLNEGALVRNGAIKATKPLAALKIPSTVQGVLASRIDRLPPTEKELLQTLAVIGREFPLSLVRAVSHMSSDYLDQAIDNLQLAEFIYEQPAEGDVEYIFKHTLTQQVAYESLLSARRKDLHEQVGSALEDLYGDSIDRHLAALANHYKQSRNVEKASEFLRRAAQQASERSAVAEAENLLRDALGILLAQPQSQERDLQELDLQMALGAIFTNRSFAASEQLEPLHRAYELSQGIGDVRKTRYVMFHLGQSLIQQGRLSEAKTFAEAAADQIQRIRDPILEACSLENLAECYWWSGDLQKPRALFQRSLEICESSSPEALIRSIGFDLCLFSVVHLAMTELLLGWPVRSSEVHKRLVKRAQSNVQPYSRFFGLILTAWILQVRGDLSALAGHVHAFQGFDEHGVYEASGLSSQYDGWARFWRIERALGSSKNDRSDRKAERGQQFQHVPLAADSTW
jgi:predicted ATPase